MNLLKRTGCISLAVSGFRRGCARVGQGYGFWRFERVTGICNVPFHTCWTTRLGEQAGGVVCIVHMCVLP
jgi:hypothetical protein